jgi:hypothetical protein
MDAARFASEADVDVAAGVWSGDPDDIVGVGEELGDALGRPVGAGGQAVLAVDARGGGDGEVGKG